MAARKILNSYFFLVTLLACLSVLPLALRAQGYQLAGGGQYHASSVYYVTLKDAAGGNINSRYAAVDGAIGAFVGDELRGVSTWQRTGNNPGQGVFLVRVWGSTGDESAATFRLHDQQGLEYQIGSHAFTPGEEATYGSPSAPIVLTLSPVTGIALPFTEITLKVGETRSVQPTFLPADHSTLLSAMKYAYSSDADAFKVSDDGTLTALAVGQGKLTVKATPGNFTAQATVKVEKAPDKVPVTEIRNNMTSDHIVMEVGEQVLLDFSVLPENATNKAVTFTNDYDIVDIRQETETSPVIIVAKKAGEDELTVISDDNGQATLTYYIKVKEKPLPPVTLTFAVQEITLSKLRDKELVIKKGSGDNVVPSKVELVFSQAANGEPVAVATMADDTGLKWTVRGKYVGEHSVKIKYNGEEQQATCRVNVPAEYTFAAGWDWISFYAAPSGGVSLPTALTSLNVDDANRIHEIRSQEQFLRYDAKLGYFGNLDILTASGASYRILSAYDEAHSARMVLNLGHGYLAWAPAQQRLVPGYTWIAYPYELDHAFDRLADELSVAADEDDMIIGRDGFAEYTGTGWKTTDGFTLRAGQGYIYYNAGKQEKTLQWTSQTMTSDPDPEPADNTRHSQLAETRYRYPETMPVVCHMADATLSGDAVSTCDVLPPTPAR